MDDRHQDTQDANAPASDSRRRFLRLVGLLWLGAVGLILAIALLAPHLGRLADFTLHQTAHREWQRLSLQTAQPYLDLSTPQKTIKSYYSALYRGDAAAMDQLTHGAFQDLMRQRLRAAEPIPNMPVYRSYLHTERQTSTEAVVAEKFHLFWRRGLRFHLRRHQATWQIVGLDLLP